MIHQRLQKAFEILDLSHMNAVYDHHAEEASKGSISYLEFLNKLLWAEIEAKRERAARTNLKLAKLPYVKTLDQFDFEFQPSANARRIQELKLLGFVVRAENVIFLGLPGVGKTHLAVGLAVEAIRNGHTAYFLSAHELITMIKETIASEWEQIRQGLRALPSVPFPCSRTHMVSTSRLLLFQLDRNTYSVPVAYVNRHLHVEAFVDRIEVYDASKRVTVHERSYSRGEKVMKLEHYLPLIQTKPRSAKNVLVVRKLPQVYQDLRVQLCSKDPEGYREFAKILLLHLEYRFEGVLAAVEEELQHHSPSQESIRQILMVHASAPKVSLKEAKSPLTHLEVPVDAPAKYDHLMGGANHDGVA